MLLKDKTYTNWYMFFYLLLKFNKQRVEREALSPSETKTSPSPFRRGGLLFMNY